jgi:hypothetical protein
VSQSAINPSVHCRLFLHAVLPCLAALVAEDERARDIAASCNAAIVFCVLGGAAATVRLAGSAVTVEPGAARRAAVILMFFSNAHLNAFFSGRSWAVPLPLWGGWRVALLARFTRLTDRLKAVLDADPDVLATAEGRNLHARLSLLAAGLGLGPLSMGDAPARAALAHAPEGLAAFSIEGVGNSTVWFDNGRRAGAAGWGPPPRAPDVAVSFADSAVAFGAMREEIDTLAAIGNGQIRVTGLIPLADGVNLAMERIGVYLQT